MLTYLHTLLSALRRDERGQGLVEYGLILVLIAVVVIGALTALGGGITTMLNTIAALFQ